MDRIELARRLARKERHGLPAHDIEKHGLEARATIEAAGYPAGWVIIEERDPRRFMAAFARAAATDQPVFLADPAWGPAERAALAGLLKVEQASPPAVVETAGGDACATSNGWLMIPSGGTSGQVKFARHDGGSIAAAVRGFCAHFCVERLNCVGVLPLHHVSGLMAWMRAALTGGSYLPWDWKQLEAGDFPVLSGAGWFLSLVPTQLQRLLGRPAAVAWLRGFDAVFVGGGPVWPELADAAARAQLPLSLGYGMTETAAMVTALRPVEFLAGDRSSGAALPHAAVTVTEDGLVRVAGDSLFRGYFPDRRNERFFVTEDLGELDDRGHLRVLGRRDDLIITGGKKVDPREVEAALRASGEFTDVAIVGVPDPEWGQAVVACFPESTRAPDLPRVVSLLGALAGFKRPRRYAPIRDWPRNAQGKLNRAALRRALGA
jgi:O-succinylbenzoic acid--CoA ligase